MRVHLETERLTLRRLAEDDLDNLVELDGDPEVMRHLNGGRPTPRETIRGMMPFILGHYERGDDLGYWAVEADGRFLGWIFFRPYRHDGPPAEVDRSGIELGYRLRRETWGKGYATEASRALIARGFDVVGVDRVFAETMAVNAGSRRVMEKAGLRHVATFDREGDSEVQYALTASEWRARTPSAE
ncbi:GNAT family N-acetyltransferase [Dactylosporangium sp. CA-139114]|uniref:GNAT family N-acetyltransferase n=1 Tax=Dactylosporangium sp. CA-139114 TaxID=3239931 RepID=UPI003D950E0C